MPIYLRNRQRTAKPDLRRIKRDLSRALSLLGFPDAELSVLFVSTAVMRRMNARYRGIDASTDVLSFPMSSEVPTGFSGVLGDIVVCVPKALSQAEDYGATLDEELMRLLIHGLLHLLGYDHEIDARHRNMMAKKEKELLRAITEMA